MTPLQYNCDTATPEPLATRETPGPKLSNRLNTDEPHVGSLRELVGLLSRFAKETLGSHVETLGFDLKQLGSR
jgi:hypothetical protein